MEKDKGMKMVGVIIKQVKAWGCWRRRHDPLKRGPLGSCQKKKDICKKSSVSVWPTETSHFRSWTVFASGSEPLMTGEWWEGITRGHFICSYSVSDKRFIHTISIICQSQRFCFIAEIKLPQRLFFFFFVCFFQHPIKLPWNTTRCIFIH